MVLPPREYLETTAGFSEQLFGHAEVVLRTRQILVPEVGGELGLRIPRERGQGFLGKVDRIPVNVDRP